MPSFWRMLHLRNTRPVCQKSRDWEEPGSPLHALSGPPIRKTLAKSQAPTRKKFKTTSSCGSRVNLLSLYQHQTTPNAPYRQPGTLRVAVFLCGAFLGVEGRQAVVKLSTAWGGLRKHKPLVQATLDWLNDVSPKLVPPEDRLPIGGGLI